jgi:hypothetical protein
VVFDSQGNPVSADGQRMGSVTMDDNGVLSETPASQPEVVRGRSGATPESIPERETLPAEPHDTGPTDEVPEDMPEQPDYEGRNATPDDDRVEAEANADEASEHMNKRTSESTSAPERDAAAAEAEERGPHPDDMRTNEAEIGSTAPDEAPDGGVFRNADGEQVLADGRTARDAYMGNTPGKYSTVGRDVLVRMRGEGRIRGTGDLLPGNPNGLEVQAADGSWHLIDENIDMMHIRDAVTYWNEEGRFYGPRSTEVREFMTEPDNYVLGPRGPNRSAGARLGETYLPPEAE